jgi:tetratricopeptide (TPR) repeat protein
MLQALKERVPRHAIPDAWLAKWFVLRVQQGWSADPKLDARQALDCTRRALDADAHCALAMAIDGFVHTNLLKRLDIAEQRYDMALDANPNESLAWLLKGTLHAFKGEGRQAVDSTLQALRLSPLDPLKYFYDSLAATAALAAGEYERAIEHARRSLRANRTHTSTLRALAIAQVQTGRDAEARETVRELLRLEPTLTVRAYLERSPSSAFETGRIWSGALRAAGLPEGD